LSPSPLPHTSKGEGGEPSEPKGREQWPQTTSNKLELKNNELLPTSYKKTNNNQQSNIVLLPTIHKKQTTSNKITSCRELGDKKMGNPKVPHNNPELELKLDTRLAISF
jgi:hypothetical protein